MTTMSALQAASLAQVKRLLGGKDAVDVAAWAHKVNKKYPWTVNLHFQKQPAWKCNGVDTTSCTGGACLLKALKHFYGKLAPAKAPQVAIDWPAGMKLTDADNIKFLINLIGDLHQPLHLGFDQGDHGRNISVRFRGNVVSLYDLWDKEMTQAVMKDMPGFWWSGWTHIQRVGREYEVDKAEWEKSHVDTFDKWAAESAKFACSEVYTNPITGKRISEESQNGVFELDKRLFEKWKASLLNKLLIAGARTAIVLNSILKDRDADNLHQGTAIEAVPVDDDDVPSQTKRQDGPNKLKHQKMDWKVALATNIGIFVVIFTVFMLTMKYTTQPTPESTKAKETGAGKGV